MPNLTVALLALAGFLYLNGEVRELRCKVDGGKMVVVTDFYGLARVRECQGATETK